MKIPNKAQLDAARAKYPKGTRVELPSGMDDEYSPLPPGMRGTVSGVDDMLNLMVRWDNDSGLNAIIGHDDIAIVPMVISDTVFNQIMEVRKPENNPPNMFDITAVQRLAFDLGFYELVTLLEEDRGAYSKFILSGERG
jgi:hypothetical protein